MIAWPDHLIDDIARRRCVLFLGSGVSKNSISEMNANVRPPDWNEFLVKALAKCNGTKRHINALLKEKDFLTACEIIKDRLGDGWNGHVHEHFVAPKFKPAEIHRDIFKLDAKIVLTQNVDKLYDNYASTESHGTVYVKDYTKTDVALFVRGDRRCILKAHGSVENPGEMIFTRKEYSDARYKFTRFYALLDALVLTHTFLFLGCGLSDPDVRLMLERHAPVFPDSRPHIIVISKNAVHAKIRECFQHNLNLRFLAYSSDEHHKELHDSIKYLVAQVELRRTVIADTRDW